MVNFRFLLLGKVNASLMGGRNCLSPCTSSLSPSPAYRAGLACFHLNVAEQCRWWLYYMCTLCYTCMTRLHIQLLLIHLSNIITSGVKTHLNFAFKKMERGPCAEQSCSLHDSMIVCCLPLHWQRCLCIPGKWSQSWRWYCFLGEVKKSNGETVLYLFSTEASCRKVAQGYRNAL